MNNRQFALIAGWSYLIIFFAAIYANFSVLDAIKAAPLETVSTSPLSVKLAALAFLVAAVADVIVAWALNELYKGHAFSKLSMVFRIIHATIMGLAVYALIGAAALDTKEAILGQVSIFDTLWLIGLFFFGFHLLLLGRIVKNIPIIPWLLIAAGVMYIVDTTANFTYANYAAHADTFLMLVAVPAILGEMSFSLWLLIKEGK